jgi:hypothetical protein
MQGIIMGGPSVLATLGRNKTQTRRVMKEQPPEGWDRIEYVNNDREIWLSATNPPKQSEGVWTVKSSTSALSKNVKTKRVIKIPHPVGAVRYVKETYWARKPVPYGEWELYYKADTPLEIQNELRAVSHNINNAMFMPERFSRLHIKITGVRVERVQDISDADVMLEGCLKKESWHLITAYLGCEPYPSACVRHSMDGIDWVVDSKEAYKAYFIKINGAKAWESNPWVFVYDYEVIWRKDDNESK